MGDSRSPCAHTVAVCRIMGMNDSPAGGIGQQAVET